MYIENCVLTGLPLHQKHYLDQGKGFLVEYNHRAVGKVRIGRIFLQRMLNENRRDHVLAGICRNTNPNDEPPIINDDFIRNGINDYIIPKEFEEKALHLLKYIYDNGGKAFKPISFNSKYDYTIAYSEDGNELIIILNRLKERHQIEFTTFEPTPNEVIFENLLLTDKGVNKILEKNPQILMIDLNHQKIATGIVNLDSKIETARELFFSTPESIEKMRSACETLIHLLEPLRTDLEKYLIKKDVNTFFQIVNDFDIRHNKAHTKTIEYPEQLEWVFYSLLNSINLYVKLKGKLNSDLKNIMNYND
ncbi:MAG: hypothetical protein IPH61_14445 [Bacteroidetes bacterium]|nr:hypothetical protein [Bacteroidota bacterium]MBK8680387.1 hypothetical protein [Bacteroidota bacterium]